MKPVIFVSAVSRELHSARQLVANTLHALGYEPDDASAQDHLSYSLEWLGLIATFEEDAAARTLYGRAWRSANASPPIWPISTPSGTWQNRSRISEASSSRRGTGLPLGDSMSTP